MTRTQTFILAILAVLVCIVFGVAAVMLRAALVSPTTIAERLATTAPVTSASGTGMATPTWTPNPTWTPSPTPTPVDTRLPTPTYTRVVPDTATPAPSSTPTVTLTPSITPTPTPARGSSGSIGGVSGGARPTPQPTSRYPLKIVEGPLLYETKNFFFVVYARITSGGALLPGYRMVGTHSPSGANIRSDPSCNYLCKGSGPRKEQYFIQEGNLAFEAFFYDTGSWSLMLIDPQGQQASEVLKIDIDRTKRVWYYYHFNR